MHRSLLSDGFLIHEAIHMIRLSRHFYYLSDSIVGLPVGHSS